MGLMCVLRGSPPAGRPPAACRGRRPVAMEYAWFVSVQRSGRVCCIWVARSSRRMCEISRGDGRYSNISLTLGFSGIRCLAINISKLGRGRENRLVHRGGSSRVISCFDSCFYIV